MNDLLSSFVVLSAGCIGLIIARRTFPAHLHKWLYLGFAAHIAGALAQLTITMSVYGGGDMVTYYKLGLRYSELLSSDFIHYAPQVLEVFNRERNSLAIFGSGTSTGSMIALSSFIVLFAFGSFYGSCFLVSMWAFFGQLAIFQVMRQSLPEQLHDRLAIAALLVPSVVFWSSGLFKEAPAMGALGWLLLGGHWIVHNRRTLLGVLLMFGAGYILGMIKSYVLFTFCIGAGAWFFWQRSAATPGSIKLLTRPLHLAVAIAIVIGSLGGLSILFPRFAPENLATETNRMQMLYARGAANQNAGSTYDLGQPRDDSATAQLALAPLGLISALFRPFIFEVHNATSFVNALEMLVILLGWVSVFRRRRLGVIRAILRSPFLVFCVAFVVPFALAVGIAAPNLGSLSRYRILMMPFYLCLLVSLLPWTRWNHPARRA